MKSIKKRSYRGFQFHYSKLRGEYKIYHTAIGVHGYFLTSENLYTITEVKKYIDKTWFKNK
jgi:REP element-mobilizing transposase RayT